LRNKRQASGIADLYSGRCSEWHNERW